MVKAQIKTALHSSHGLLVRSVAELTESQCMVPPAEKWTGLQHIRHIELTLSPMVKFLSDREKYFSRNFGETDTMGRSYESIQNDFVRLLVPGILAPERYTPAELVYTDKEIVFEALRMKADAMLMAMDNWTEEEIDRYLIPHPLLGNLTLREQLYFAIYHAEHHRKNVERTLTVLPAI